MLVMSAVTRASDRFCRSGGKGRRVGDPTADDPDGAQFERWLLQRVLASPTPGALRAMAALILDEFRFAATQPHFGAWLAAGAPSADADEAPRVKRDEEVNPHDHRRRFDFDPEEHWCPICSSENVRNG